MQACFCPLQSSTLTVQAPIMISLQKQNLDNSVYSTATLMQKEVLYLTGKVSKFTFLSMLMFWLLISPKATLTPLFLSIDLIYIIGLNDERNKILLFKGKLLRMIRIALRNIKYGGFSQLVSVDIKEANKAAFITLTNPKKRNTLSSSAMRDLSEAFTQVERSVNQKKTKIVFLKSQGPVFSSGHDLKELQGSSNPKQIFDLCSRLMLQVKKFSAPTVCVVNGIAAAAGFQLSMACDMTLATQKSTFSCPGIKWGLFCSTPAVELVRSISSQKKANEMLIFGQQISAQQALQYGIINKVLADEEALNKQIDNFIQKANNLSGQVIFHGKKVIQQQKNKNIEEAYQIAGEGMCVNISEKADCKEGLAAFSQKRHPHYKN